MVTDTEAGHVRAEQTARIVLRDTALYIHVVSVLSISGLMLQTDHPSRLGALTLFSAMTLFGIYVSSDYYVSRIGEFISQSDTYVQAWEKFHRRGFSYLLQKGLRAIIVLSAFVVVPFGFAITDYDPADFDLLDGSACVMMLLILAEALVYGRAEFARRTAT